MNIMKSFFRNTLIIFSSVLICVVSGCKASIKVEALSDSSTAVEFSTQLGEVLGKTIASLSAAAGNEVNDIQIFSEKEITEAFKNSDLTECKVNVSTKDSVSIKGKILPPAKQKMVSDTGGLKIANFVNCGSKNLTLIISPSLVQTVVNTLPEDEKAMTDILMAPVLTGDEMSAEDYIDLIAIIFGDETAHELSSASLTVTMIAPDKKAVTKTALSDAKNVKTNGNKVTFTIPVVDLLTLSEAKTFSISW